MTPHGFWGRLIQFCDYRMDFGSTWCIAGGTGILDCRFGRFVTTQASLGIGRPATGFVGKATN